MPIDSLLDFEPGLLRGRRRVAHTGTTQKSDSSCKDQASRGLINLLSSHTDTVSTRTQYSVVDIARYVDGVHTSTSTSSTIRSNGTEDGRDYQSTTTVHLIFLTYLRSFWGFFPQTSFCSNLNVEHLYCIRTSVIRPSLNGKADRVLWCVTCRPRKSSRVSSSSLAKHVEMELGMRDFLFLR